MFRSRAFIVHAVALGALFASPVLVHAHEVVPPDWCIDEKREPQIVAKFEFDEKELREVMAKCGIVEHDEQDAWHAVSSTMSEYCEIVAPRKNAMPFITGPQSYLSKEHHKTYKISEGITGSCAVCPPKPKR